MKVIRGFNAQGVVACFDEPNITGNVLDYDASRNGPVKTPELFLDKISFHSDFFQYELLTSIQTVSVTHAAVAVVTKKLGISSDGGGGLYNGGQAVSLGITVSGNEVVTTHVLYTHNLGYIPKAMVSFAGALVTTGTIIHNVPAGGRFVSVYATTTQIILKVNSFSNTSVLPSITRSYQVLVLRSPEKDNNKPLFAKSGSNMQLGKGKIDLSKKYLRRVAAGESSFDIDLGRTIDIKNGSSRVVTGGITTTQPGYNGSFTGSTYIPIGTG